MKEKIFKNLSLKILSAVFAVVLWTIIVNIYDPTTSYTFSNVTVQLINTESLTDKNYSYEVVDGGKISVYVSGPKSVVTNIKASDIVATADLSKISAFADYVDIHVSVVQNGQVLSNVEATPKTSAVKLSIENRDTKTVNVTANVTGSPADGYVVVKESLNPTSIKVTGPSSVIDTVAYAGVSFDVTGATGDLNGDAAVHLYNDDGGEIVDESLDVSQTTVGYTAQVVRYKTVNVEAQTSGTPKDGYRVDSVTCSQSQVQVYGDETVLNNLEKIVIPSGSINVDNLSEDKVYKLSLSNYIDKSLHILNDSRVDVTVKIVQAVSDTVIFNTSDIKVVGLNTGMSYNFTDKTFNIEVERNAGNTTALDASAVTVRVSLTGYTTSGSAEVKPDITLPEGYTLKSSDIKVRVELKNNNSETKAEETSTNTDTKTNTTER